MAFYPSKISQKRTDNLRLVAIAILLTGILSALAIATALSCYFAWQHHTLIVQQRDRQEQEQVHWTILDHAESFKLEANYPACLGELQKLSESSKLYPRIRRLAGECYDPLAQDWLDHAENFAVEGNLVDAINTALKIDGGSFQAYAQQQIEAWSRQILEVAKQHYLDPSNQFTRAVNKASTIPEGSSLYPQSQETINAWQQQWYANENYWQTAQAALESNDLATAYSKAMQISEHPFWSPHRNEILLNIQTVEQRYEQILQQANQQLAQRQPDDAKQLIQQLPDFEPWATHKLKVIRESRTAIYRQKWNSYLIGLMLVVLLVSILKYWLFA